ncbi:MAG: DUF1254 domain-containing protein [Anaerolineales bacterium]|nr:DUF1254 domain-containing protein [Anaerolineales bacterium]
MSNQSYSTRIGELVFTHDFANGYPTGATVEKLFDEMDFQRACQVYIWSIPIVSFAQWQFSHNEQLGAKNGQIVYFETYEDKLGGLTYQLTTPYAIPFIDLEKEGPYVAEMPPGEIRGAAHDSWQIGITQVTDPGKYLFVAPGEETPLDAEGEGFRVYQSPTNNLLLGIRLMPESSEEREALLEKVKIYPYSEKHNPNPRGYIRPKGKPWLAAHPRGMEYWVRLADILNREPVFERDRFFMAMLKPLGIEKGMPFNPDELQTKILTEAAFVGEAMAKANDFFNPRLEASHYVEGSRWEYATVSPPDQRWEHYDALDGRAAWFYEAVTNDIAMHGQEIGWGQVYLAAYQDSDGDWLDGGVNYVLHVPANAPAEAFWSMTLYDVDTRCIIKNEQGVPDRSSRMDLLVNEDSSVDIYIGPDAPAGKEGNWIPTVVGKAWFPYFRLYSPQQAFLDKSWILPDIEKL